MTSPAVSNPGAWRRCRLSSTAADSNTATIAMGYADVVALAYSQGVAVNTLRRTGGRMIQTPVDLRPRVWFNADMESKNYIIPGLIAVIMMVIAALLTSLTVAP